MVLSFANGRPDSIDITFGHLGGLSSKTVTLTKAQLSGMYIPINADISAKVTCPSISYKITQDSASENAITSFQLTEGGMGLCTYERSSYGATYPTGKKVSMKQYKGGI